MDRYFTIMVVPEREKGVKSFRVPRLFVHTIATVIVFSATLLAILGYDYWKILRQVYENKHLTTENRELKEQIQLFQMKINTLTADIKRIHTFEKKLKIITGIEETDMSQSIHPLGHEESQDDHGPEYDPNPNFKKDPSLPRPDTSSLNQQEKIFRSLNDSQAIENVPEYIQLKNLYEQKIATTFGLQTGYSYTKKWSELTKHSFALAEQFAKFDYQFQVMKDLVKELEVDIHKLDQFLLDKDSFTRSLPTLLPTKGWITSYYGHRKSPYSGRIKMHEGLDIGARIGTTISAPADGIVTYSGKKPGFGILVQLDHGYGIETLYAHAQTSAVKKGQKVKRGSTIAQVGNTGYSTGPHLHYEVRANDTPVDPLYYILD